MSKTSLNAVESSSLYLPLPGHQDQPCSCRPGWPSWSLHPVARSQASQIGLNTTLCQLVMLVSSRNKTQQNEHGTWTWTNLTLNLDYSLLLFRMPRCDGLHSRLTPGSARKSCCSTRPLAPMSRRWVKRWVKWGTCIPHHTSMPVHKRGMPLERFDKLLPMLRQTLQRTLPVR